MKTYHITDNIPRYKECIEKDYTFAEAVADGKMTIEKCYSEFGKPYFVVRNQRTCETYKIK